MRARRHRADEVVVADPVGDLALDFLRRAYLVSFARGLEGVDQRLDAESKVAKSQRLESSRLFLLRERRPARRRGRGRGRGRGRRSDGAVVVESWTRDATSRARARDARFRPRSSSDAPDARATRAPDRDDRAVDANVDARIRARATSPSMRDDGDDGPANDASLPLWLFKPQSAADPNRTSCAAWRR